MILNAICLDRINMTVTSVLFLGVIFLLHPVLGQIPLACVTEESLQSRTCCPMYDGAVCGGTLRGMCDNIHANDIYHTNYDSTQLQQTNSNASNAYNDARFNWPTGFFDSVCVCIGNHAGYHCGECRFGYGGENCETKLDVRIRRSAANMSPSEWEKYNMYLNRSKNEISNRYMVYTGGNVSLVSNYQSVSLYNLAVWLHHYAARTDQPSLPQQSGMKD